MPGIGHNRFGWLHATRTKATARYYDSDGSAALKLKLPAIFLADNEYFDENAVIIAPHK